MIHLWSFTPQTCVMYAALHVLNGSPCGFYMTFAAGRSIVQLACDTLVNRNVFEFHLWGFMALAQKVHIQNHYHLHFPPHQNLQFIFECLVLVSLLHQITVYLHTRAVPPHLKALPIA